MTQPASVGTLTKFGLDTVNPVTKSYEYKSFSVGKHGNVLSTDGIRGTRSHPVERTRAGVYTIDGSIVMEPGPVDLDALLPLILGGAPSGSGTVTYPVAETLPSFFVTIDRIAAMATFAGCVMDSATFSAQQGSLLELSLNIAGKTETLGVVTGFAGLTPSLQPPYVMMDAVLTFAGGVQLFKSASFTVNNSVKRDRFMNSVTRTDVPALDRTVEVSLDLPYTTDQSSIYDLNATSATVLLTFTNGVFVFSASFAAVQFPTIPPTTPGRDEVLLPLHGIARSSGATKEIVITNKSA